MSIYEIVMIACFITYILLSYHQGREVIKKFDEWKEEIELKIFETKIKKS